MGFLPEREAGAEASTSGRPPRRSLDDRFCTGLLVSAEGKELDLSGHPLILLLNSKDRLALGQFETKFSLIADYDNYLPGNLP